MPLLFGIPLRLLMSKSWNLSNRSYHLPFYSFLFPLQLRSYIRYFEIATLRERSCLQALSFVNVYFGFKFFPSLLDAVGLKCYNGYLGQCCMFIVGSSCEHCPPVRCLTAANTVCKDTDTFRKQSSFPRIHLWFCLLLKHLHLVFRCIRYNYVKFIFYYLNFESQLK